MTQMGKISLLLGSPVWKRSPRRNSMEIEGEELEWSHSGPGLSLVTVSQPAWQQLLGQSSPRASYRSLTGVRQSVQTTACQVSQRQMLTQESKSFMSSDKKSKAFGWSLPAGGGVDTFPCWFPFARGWSFFLPQLLPWESSCLRPHTSFWISVLIPHMTLDPPQRSKLPGSPDAPKAALCLGVCRPLSFTFFSCPLWLSLTLL